MPAVDDKILDGEDPLEPPSTKQSTSLHPVSLSGMPMHIYPYSPAPLPTQQPIRSKRRQVKNACTNCQKACKKCDDARPCLRCVKYGISEECVDSQRKERQKGIKRGPYKKRDGGRDRASSSIDHSDFSQQGMSVSNSVPPQSGSQIPGSLMPLSYHPGFYGQYSPLVSKPSDGLPIPMYTNPPYFLAPVPHGHPQMHGASEGDSDGYPAQAFYPAPVFTPVAYHHPQYVSRSDGPGPIPTPYPIYGTPVYPKHSSGAGQDEIQHGGSTRSEERDRVSNTAD
ncbi:hypothetical protein BYT27DRAFT_7195488 [Phlegmacium glaucopus]|nr:hypothetical protein BYT27DRAFT_7195488 [Phlegmacium glaucopus]